MAVDEVEYLRAAGTSQLAIATSQAIARGNSGTSRTLVKLGELLGRGVAPAQRQEMFARIGLRAKRAAVGSYDNTVTRHKRPASMYPYRADASGRMRRYAGGALRRALNKDDFFRATPDGLEIINATTLNREARHWARLNAGAGSIGRGSRRSFEVTASNLVLFTMGLDMAPRPGFKLPPGGWFDRGSGRWVQPGTSPAGSQEFHPSRRTPKRIQSRGIEARNFLDAPVARVARDLFSQDYGYPRLLRQIYAAANVEERAQLGFRAPPARFAHRVRVSARF